MDTYLLLMFIIFVVLPSQPGADLNQLSELSEHMVDSEDIAPGTLTLHLTTTLRTCVGVFLNIG